MSEEEHEMEHDGEDSDSEYEVIALNPSVMYESDDSSSDDEFIENIKIEISEPVVVAEIKENVKVNTEVSVDKMEEEEEVSCDSSVMATIDDENSVSSIDNIKKVRKKLKLEEYQQRRANQKPDETKPLFDLPKRVANYELCDVPSSLPLLILPTDPDCLVMMSNNQIVVKEEPGNDGAFPAFNPALYEEIIIVSMACNTEITIPPFEENMDQQPASNFLVNIVNNLNKNNNVESLLNSSTSLFSSIQAVVQGKCTTAEAEGEEISNKDKEHGEDKTIMHLRKDRLRPFKCSIAIQTDSQPLFPPLILAPTPKYNRSRNARNFRRKVSRSRSRSRSFSPSMDYDHRIKCNGRYSRSQHSTHSSSMTGSSESEGSDSDSDESSCSESSDSLKRFNDRQNFRFYNRNQRDQGFKYPEERRVVYIGELEEETSKEDIRKKFLNYGTIKKISLHQKEDGLRYGFVTFAEVACAYEVIDKFSKDPLISKYDIRFGGRRKFCKQSYADLDSLAEKEYEESQKSTKNLSFEDLLNLAKKKISAKK